MTLTIRKMIVLGLIGAVLLVGNTLFVANWLAERGVVAWAENIRTEYLTGTAIAVIAALLILVVNPRNGSRAFGLILRCPVCDKRLIENPSCCGECGSKI